MNKLKLSLDELNVTSFTTATVSNDERGTVLGNGIIHAAMQTLSMSLVPLMQRDIRRWKERQVGAAAPPA